MLVVLANDLPAAVRGRMKLWFIEPRANVFVSGIKDSVADDVIKYLNQSCPQESGLCIFEKSNRTPGYKIWSIGDTSRQVAFISGLPLVIEKTGTSFDKRYI